MEVTGYIVTRKEVNGVVTETSKKGPAQVFEFKYRKFLENIKAEIERQETKTDQEVTNLANINTLLAKQDVLWVEDAIGNKDFDSLWYDVFSSALDEFPSMNEDANVLGGLPVKVEPMQWDIRVPYESNKVVTLRTGAYIGNIGPEVIELQFEDEQSRKNRQTSVAQYNTVIARLTTELDALEEGTDPHTNKQQELNAYTTERDRMLAVEYRTISDLLEHPSVQTSLVQVLMGLIGVIKVKQYPDLDLQMVQERLVGALATIR